MLKNPLMRGTALTTLLVALTLAAGADTAAAQTAVMHVPARELSPLEQINMSGVPAMTGVTLRTAATARASAYNQAEQKQTERKSGSAAAVYAGTHGTNPPKLPSWPTPDPGGLLKFEDKGNLAQAWATTTTSGIPYVFATGYGQFRAEATAAWSTTLTVPSGPAREVVARFVLPPVRVNGDTKGDNAEAFWRARMRADFLVNGYPAWSTEAMRLTANPSAEPNDTIVLQQFGAFLNFPQNDEDTDPNNNSSTSTTDPSAKRTVYVTLGRHAGGTVLDVSLSVRGTALTMPPDSAGNRCKRGPDPVTGVERWFCSNATVTVRGESGDGPLFYMLP
jgi:hypothetical protein